MIFDVALANCGIFCWFLLLEELHLKLDSFYTLNILKIESYFSNVKLGFRIFATITSQVFFCWGSLYKQYKFINSFVRHKTTLSIL